MNIGELLSAERTACNAVATSKKRAIEMISEMIASATPSLTQGEIFGSLLNRERLGSTGLGHGVAIPHGRLAGTDQPIAALIKLKEGVEYDAPDQQPVDLLFALLVPEKSTEEHLHILALLAEMFADQQLLEKLRAATDVEALLTLVSQWQPNNAA